MKRIIIVEDDPAVQDALTMVLRKTGFEVLAYPDATALMEKSAPAADIYVLDKQLPGVDGLEVCRFLKSNPDTAAIPVIITSASPQIERLSKEAGADRFIEKPFRNTTLVALVKELTNHS